MKITIPLYIESRGGKHKTYTARALFFPRLQRQHEHLERALHHLADDLRELLRDLGKAMRHDELARWSFCPAVDERRLDVEIELRKRTARARMLFVVFDALGRRVAFSPRLPELWFEVGRGEALTARANEALTEHFRKRERDDEEDFEPPEKFALDGTAWVSSLEMDIHPAQRMPAAQTDRFAGLGEVEVHGGEVELRRTGRCLDRLYPEGLDRTVLLDAEVEELTRLLQGSDRRPVLLLGPPLVGKSAVIQEHVWRTVAARRDPHRDHPHVWLLSPQRLVSGMMYVGQWENRLLAILAEAKKRDHTLYFDDLLGLYHAGRTSQSDLSIAHVLKPYIERREVRLLAEMRPEALRVLRERDRGFADLFQVLPVKETNEEDTLRILIAVLRQFEALYRCRFALDVLPAAIDLTRRYLRHQAFPGKAALALRRLAVKSRDSDVGRADLLKAFHEQTGLALGFLDGRHKLPREEVLEVLGREIVGQPAALAAAADVISVAKARLNDPDRPLGVFLFLGPTGVGKTQCAKAIAAYLFGDAERLVRIDMNEFLSGESAARLAGTFDQPEGVLTAAIRRQPFAVLLLDEIEKAHPDVFDLLLQVLGEGRLSDALGRTVDFTNVLIILTSNLGVREAEATMGLRPGDGHNPAAYTEAAQKFFRPEFFNRIDRVVPFGRLGRSEVSRIAQLLIRDVLTREGLLRRKCVLRIEPAALERVIDVGFDPLLGARALKRAIERQLAQPVAAQLAAGVPETITVISAFAGGEGITIDVRGLEEVAPVEDGGVSGEFEAAMAGAIEALGRIEAAVAPLRDGGQALYYAVREQVRALRAQVGELRERRQARREAARGLPALPAVRMRHTKKTVHDWARYSPLAALASAADVTLYLEELASQARVVEEGEPHVGQLVEALAVLDVIAAQVERPEGEQVLLYLWAANASGAAFVERLAALYQRVGFLESPGDEGESWWGLEQQRVEMPEDGAERAVVVRGLAAGRFVAGEVGTHLFCPDNAALVPVQVHAWPVADGEAAEAVLRRHREARAEWLAALARGEADVGGDPLALAPVVRIYNHSRHAFDLRSGRAFDGEPDVPALVRAALPVPAEVRG